MLRAESLIQRALRQPFSLPNIAIGISISWPWSGILEAAPKKRTSHRKKRQRQLSGNNQEKPLRNLNRCPACGHYKRAHTLCMHCVTEIRNGWRKEQRSVDLANQDKSKIYQGNESESEFNYPSPISQKSLYQETLDKREYILSRPRSLPVQPKEPKEKKLPLIMRRPYK